MLSGCKVIKVRDLDGASPEETWIWEERRFQRAGKPTIVKDGLHPEVLYAKKHITPLLPNGEGPYCEFVVPGLPSTPGVYAFFVGGTLRYIGRAKNLRRRFAQGYGHISPRNCYAGGQATNIRLNKKVREIVCRGEDIAIFYHVTQDYVALENSMIQALQPRWNIQGIITK